MLLSEAANTAVYVSPRHFEVSPASSNFKRANGPRRSDVEDSSVDGPDALQSPLQPKPPSISQLVEAAGSGSELAPPSGRPSPFPFAHRGHGRFLRPSRIEQSSGSAARGDESPSDRPNTAPGVAWNSSGHRYVVPAVRRQAILAYQGCILPEEHFTRPVLKGKATWYPSGTVQREANAQRQSVSMGPSASPSMTQPSCFMARSCWGDEKVREDAVPWRPSSSQVERLRPGEGLLEAEENIQTAQDLQARKEQAEEALKELNEKHNEKLQTFQKGTNKEVQCKALASWVRASTLEAEGMLRNFMDEKAKKEKRAKKRQKSMWMGMLPAKGKPGERWQDAERKVDLERKFFTKLKDGRSSTYGHRKCSKEQAVNKEFKTLFSSKTRSLDLAELENPEANLSSAAATGGQQVAPVP